MDALHSSAACRIAWLIHGSACQKSYHKSVYHEKEADTHSVWIQPLEGFSRRVSEIRKRPREIEFQSGFTQLPFNAFNLFNPPAAASLQSFNNSELEERRQPCLLHLCLHLLPFYTSSASFKTIYHHASPPL